jgi:two-component system sensor kinase FixL
MYTRAGRKSERTFVANRGRAAGDVEALARQQTAVARLSHLALTGVDLSSLMREATSVVARTLRVKYCKVLELLPGDQAFLLRAGVGWKEGYVGRIQVGAQKDSQAGYTLLSRHPIVTEDLRKERRFHPPPLLVEHNIQSGISTIILRQGRGRPFGVLGAHSKARRQYSTNDINFVRTVANVLATAIERKEAEEALQQQAQVLDQIHDAVVATDLNGLVINWNQGATRLFGYSEQEAMGRHISFVYRNDQHKLLEKGIIQPLKKKGVHQLEVQMQKKSGETFYAHLALSLLRDSSGKTVGMIGYSMDITAKKEAEDHLRLLSSRLLHAEDEERRRIARELHDGLGQYLVHAKMSLECYLDKPDGPQALIQTLDSLDRCLAEARTISYLLHPPFLDELGFASAAGSYVDGFAKRSGIQVHLHIVRDLQRLPGTVELVLFRILQESLTNVHRHSHSDSVDIHVELDGNHVVLSVRDYGKGIPGDLLEKLRARGDAGGVGLSGMRERVIQLAGRFEIQSDAKGTLIRADLPLSKGNSSKAAAVGSIR